MQKTATQKINPHSLLKETLNPPESLYYEGNTQLLEHLPERGLAIVGTRQPRTEMRKLVTETVHALRGSQLIVISGLALGIDSIAHEAALAANLPTIAVLANGLEQTYPRQNLGLRRRILQRGGLVLSEYPPDQAPRKHQFLQRNRLIAALARATWLVQAPQKSGALNTAHWAIQNQRDLYITSCQPGDPQFAGNQSILEQNSGTPFWSLESLGATWLELVSHRARTSNDAEWHKSLSQDGVPVLEALQSCQERFGWSPEEFFEELHSLLAVGKLTEEDGLLKKGKISV